MCAAEGVFKTFLYRNVNSDGTPTERLRDLTFNLYRDTNGAKEAGFGERLR
jgi:hypothetical protein